MDNKVTDIIFSLFTWFGRAGRIRFIVTYFLLIIFASPFMIWEVLSSLQNIIVPILAWGGLMQFIKRGHDFGAPGWVSLMAYLASPFLIPTFFWAVMPGDDTYNKYGVRDI